MELKIDNLKSPNACLRGFTPTGGKIVVSLHPVGMFMNRYTHKNWATGGGASNLTQQEYDAYKRAGLLLSRGEEGDGQQAFALLKEAGFDLFIE